MQKKLVIALPTFNRGAYLNEWLKIHANYLFLLGVDIFVFDNASTDNTEHVVNKWKSKYKNISYVKNNTNIGAIQNALNPFTIEGYRYIWPMGDSYFASFDTIKNVINLIKETPELIVINLQNKIKKNFKDMNVENKIAELSGVISCYGVLIYKWEKHIFNEVNKYKKSFFPHLIYMANRAIFKNHSICWSPENSLEVIKLEERRKNWANGQQVFEIGAKSWVDSINLMPLSSQNKKIAYKKLSEVSGLFGIKSLVYLRAQGLMNFSSIGQYFSPLRKIIGAKLLSAILISFIPLMILRPVLLFTNKNIIIKFSSSFNKFFRLH